MRFPEEPESTEVTVDIDTDDIDEDASDGEQTQSEEPRRNQPQEELNLFDDEE